MRRAMPPVLLPLRDKLIERIKSLDLVQCAQLEFECVMPVVDIELTGFYMNKHRWLEQLTIVEERRAELANELQEMLGEGVAQASLFGPARANINLDSQQQVTEALNRLGIPLPDSTRNWKLQPLAAQYPVVAKLLEYRTMQKALTSYGQNMIEFINPKTGRLHADFRQIGAPTGRFACTNPNIQQVPHAPRISPLLHGPSGRTPAGHCRLFTDRVAHTGRVLRRPGLHRRVQLGRRSASRDGRAGVQC